MSLPAPDEWASAPPRGELKVASWNVNSVRVRAERIVEWLRTHSPDVLCLQEIKTLEAHFPYAAFHALGYTAAVFGQKTYNGVAILSRLPMTELSPGFMGEPADPEARLLAATIAGVRVHSVYVPNGQSLTSDRYAHKLRWLGRLGEHFDRRERDQPLLFCGDFNVAPDERDLYDPAAFGEDVVFHVDVRNAYARLVGPRGLVDTFRLFHPETGHFSWWDYRQLGFAKGRGLRIDLILATEDLAKCCTSASIDREARKGTQPSDHAPVLAAFKL